MEENCDGDGFVESEDEMSAGDYENDDDYYEDQSNNIQKICPQERSSSKLFFLEILQHFAAYTSQNQNDMTYLLTLLKEHEPVPDYSSLPRTGKTLVKICGDDWPSNGNSKKLPPAIAVGTGKYLHFGVESALNGESVGIVHRDADLLQFVDKYIKDPNVLPTTYLKEVGNNEKQSKFFLKLILSFLIKD